MNFRNYFNARRPRHRIYLLSHMRANTSLLGHILGSNKSIEGYCELHKSYLNRKDLIASRRDYYYSHPPKSGASYFFDKLLHNKLAISDDIIGYHDKIIFMIREPRASVSSIYALFKDRPNTEWSSVQGTEKYYIERLRWLQDKSHTYKGRYVFLKAEDLLEKSDHALSELGEFLGLDEPLSKTYDTFNKTGKRGFGDTSQNIKAGELLSRKPKTYPEIDVSPDVNFVYEETVNILIGNSAHYIQ